VLPSALQMKVGITNRRERGIWPSGAAIIYYTCIIYSWNNNTCIYKYIIFISIIPVLKLINMHYTYIINTCIAIYNTCINDTRIDKYIIPINIINTCIAATEQNSTELHSSVDLMKDCGFS